VLRKSPMLEVVAAGGLGGNITWGVAILGSREGIT
jgi:hypothetical protein